MTNVHHYKKGWRDMNLGAILAGGTGTRMNISDMPKQFLPLGNKPIIIHTLEKFLSCTRLDQIYIGVHKDWDHYLLDLIERYIPNQVGKVRTVVGGPDRNSTIQCIVAAIEKDYGEDDEHIIVTHDAVRPFVSLRMIEENIDGAVSYGAVDTVISAIDTIVVSDDGKTIADIPERARMYQGQTPQSFRISVLKRLYSALQEDEKSKLTDACKICLIGNYPVHLIEGSGTNIKITTPADYKIAQAMVGGEPID